MNIYTNYKATLNDFVHNVCVTYMTERLKTRILHAAGARLRKVRCVANWAGLSALACDEIVRIMLILCVWLHECSFAVSGKLSRSKKPAANRRTPASAPRTWPPWSSVKVFIRLWFTPSDVAFSSLLLLKCRMLMANVSQRGQLTLAKTHFWFSVLSVNQVPFILFSSQHFWACQTKPDWFRSPNVWWTWVCHWSLRVELPKPCGTRDWTSRRKPRKFCAGVQCERCCSSRHECVCVLCPGMWPSWRDIRRCWGAESRLFTQPSMEAFWPGKAPVTPQTWRSWATVWSGEAD